MFWRLRKKSPVRLMRCDAKLFICAQLRMCAEDGESQTLLIISALIRMSALKNILEGLQLAHSDRWIMVPESGHWQISEGFQRLSALAEK